jgi:hypothetical protein
VRVRFPSPALQVSTSLTIFDLLFRKLLPDAAYWSECPPSGCFPFSYSIFELNYAGVRARLETCFLPRSAGALKLVTQVRFHRPLHRRPLQRDVQDIGIAMNPHRLQGLPRWPRRSPDRPVRAAGTEDQTGGRRACAAVPDARAALDPAVRRAGDPVRRSARGERRIRGRSAVKVREGTTARAVR